MVQYQEQHVARAPYMLKGLIIYVIVNHNYVDDDFHALE